MRNIALVVLLGAVVEALVDFLFKGLAAARFAPGASLLGAFGVFHGVMSVVGLLLQTTLSRTALRHLGIAGTVALRPALTAVSSILGATLPGFATATFARGAHESLTNSLFRSAYELLYTPVPEAEKRRVKALVDVSVDKVGTFLGSGLIALWPLVIARAASNVASSECTVPTADKQLPVDNETESVITPPPTDDQVLPFHLARPFAGTPPAEVKLPPA